MKLFVTTLMALFFSGAILAQGVTCPKASDLYYSETDHSFRASVNHQEWIEAGSGLDTQNPTCPAPHYTRILCRYRLESGKEVTLTNHFALYPDLASPHWIKVADNRYQCRYSDVNDCPFVTIKTNQ